MLSHLSIQLLLYSVNTNFATLIISLPLLRVYFRSFMGRNQFKKSSARAPNASAGEEEVRQELQGLFQFVPKKLEQDFSVFMGFFERFANFVPTPFSNWNRVFPVFIGLQERLFQLFQFSTSPLYINTYIETPSSILFSAL